jgi:RNA polymerase sigma factor (sigma-70 family)
MSGERPTDRELFDAWKGGDADQGEALFERYFDSLYGFFETKCPAEADELVQATFLACLRAKDTFRHDASFRTFLFAIARRRLYDFLRERHRDRGAIDFGVSSIEDLHTTPGTRLARHAEQQRLLVALRSLSLDQQTLLELHYMQDMDIPELAEVFEAPAVTIRSRLFRARKELRAILEQDPAVARGHVESEDSVDAWARGLSRRHP